MYHNFQACDYDRLIVVVFNIGQEITVVVLVTAGYETERRFGYKSKHYILNIMQNFFR